MSALPQPDKRLCDVCGATIPTEELFRIRDRHVCPLCIGTQARYIEGSGAEYKYPRKEDTQCRK